MNNHGHYDNKEPNILGKYHGDQLFTFFICLGQCRHHYALATIPVLRLMSLG